MDKKTIVYLDDFKIYQGGVCRDLQRPQGKYHIECFNHPDDALEYIDTSFMNGSKVDLIITDFTQIAGNGYKFASTVKAWNSGSAFLSPYCS